jgi:hypothetical protein
VTTARGCGSGSGSGRELCDDMVAMGRTRKRRGFGVLGGDRNLGLVGGLQNRRSVHREPNTNAKSNTT